MQFRKKPVVVEAVHFDSPAMHTPVWMREAILRGDAWWQGGSRPYFTIKTLEGEMRANVGDWIIRGIKGELYPCKPDIFAATYEPAHTAQPREGEVAEQIAAALEESIKLQSHYAELLNSYDGGQRMAFKNAQAWLDRLTLLRQRPAQGQS